MTAPSSDPGRDPERYLTDVFDRLAVAGTCEASVRIAAQAANELAGAAGLCLLSAGDRCVVALSQREHTYRCDLRGSAAYQAAAALHRAGSGGPQLVWGRDDSIRLPTGEQLRIGVAWVVPMQGSGYLAASFFWQPAQETDPQRTRRLDLLAKALGLAARAWERDRAAADVQHRLRNNLALMRSIIRRSSETAASAEHFTLHLDARIGALARSHGALTATGEAGVELEDIIRTELIASAATEQRCAVQGPAVRLHAKAAESLALAVHELATNSLKFGALAAPLGRLAIRWTVTDGTAPRLRIGWIESGVTVASATPRRRGFGQELIECTLPYELGAQTRLTFRPGGVLCEIDIPLEACAATVESAAHPAAHGAGRW